MKKIKRISSLIIAAAISVAYSMWPMASVRAAEQFSFALSPMTQSIVLNPGDVYNGSFKVVNPNANTSDLAYSVERRSFYVDEDYSTTYDEVDSPIVEWTTITSGESGVVKPNSSADVTFTIRVPRDAPSGGQYEAFRVSAGPAEEAQTGDSGLVIKEQFIITYLVFAEIAGEKVRQGEIVGIDVPGFLFSGNITGSASIRNTGNIYGRAKYMLQVFPLFSNEEVYTTEEDPATKLILPDRTLYNETAWAQTPSIGIFNVVYTVEFEGVTAQVSKMVIKCPIWVLAIVIFAIAAIIIWLVIRAKNRK